MSSYGCTVSEYDPRGYIYLVQDNVTAQTSLHFYFFDHVCCLEGSVGRFPFFLKKISIVLRWERGLFID